MSINDLARLAMLLCVPQCYDPCEKKTRFTHRETKVWQKVSVEAIYLLPRQPLVTRILDLAGQLQGLLNIGKQGVKNIQI